MALLLLQHYFLLITTTAARPEDPRTVQNLYGMTPAALAAHRNQRQLAQLLMPSHSLRRVLQAATPEALGWVWCGGGRGVWGCGWSGRRGAAGGVCVHLAAQAGRAPLADALFVLPPC
jgi:hypothetical protein